jgi:lysophospholipase L1-like esterase
MGVAIVKNRFQNFWKVLLLLLGLWSFLSTSIAIVCLVRTDILPRIKARFLPSAYGEQYHIGTVGYLNAFSAQIAMQDLVEEGCICFLGDSLTRSLRVEDIAPHAVNLGIPGDTSFGVLHRCNQYPFINDGRCHTAFVAIGTNDLSRFENDRIVRNIQGIAKELSARCHSVIIHGILPVRDAQHIGRSIELNSRIAMINNAIEIAVSGLQNVKFSDPGLLFLDHDDLLDKRYTVDGLHLSDMGCRLWVNAIKSELNNAPAACHLKGVLPAADPQRSGATVE